MGYLCFCPIFE